MCTREPTQRQRSAVSSSNFLWTSEPLQSPPPRPKAEKNLSVWAISSINEVWKRKCYTKDMWVDARCWGKDFSVDSPGFIKNFSISYLKTLNRFIHVNDGPQCQSITFNFLCFLISILQCDLQFSLHFLIEVTFYLVSSYRRFVLPSA